SWGSLLSRCSGSLVCVPLVHNHHRPTSPHGSRRSNTSSRTSSSNWQKHRSVSISQSGYSARHGKSGGLAARDDFIPSGGLCERIPDRACRDPLPVVCHPYNRPLPCPIRLSLKPICLDG